MNQEQQLENAIAAAREALEAGQQQVNAAKTERDQAVEALARAQQAEYQNGDDDLAARLESESGKARRGSIRAAKQLAQVETEVGLPVLQAAVTSAEHSLAAYLAEQRRTQLQTLTDAKGPTLRELMAQVVALLAEFRSAAKVSCVEFGLPETRSDVLFLLASGNELSGIDLSLLKGLTNAPPLVRLSFAVHGEFPQWLEHATDPSEPVRLALQGIPVLQTLAARHSEQVTAQRDTARAKLEAECATLAKQVADEIAKLGTPSAGRMNGGASVADCQAACLSAKAERVALRRPLPFDTFEIQWSTQVAGVRPPKYNEFTSNLKVAQQYDRTREALDSYSMTGWERSDAIARASSQMGQPRFENHGTLQP